MNTTQELWAPNSSIVCLSCISLWRPWADWVALEWKMIETRLHNRFAKLAGQRIAIHAAMKWDNDAVTAAKDYLDETQSFASTLIRLDKDRNGHVLCTALVKEHRALTAADSADALIDCGSVQRHGLVLTDIQRLPVCPETKVTGRQGQFGVNLPAALFAPSAPSGGRGSDA